MKATRIFYTLIPALLLTLLTAFAVNGCKNQENAAIAESNSHEAAAVPVSVTVIEPVSMRDVISLPGETEAYEDVKVSANAAGRVEWIGPREGQTVEKGALLAKIDVSAHKAALEHARASYNLAKDLYERRRRLYANRIIAKEELDQSETQLKLARTDIDQIKVRYEHGFPKSPITGIINHLYLDAGEYKPYLRMVRTTGAWKWPRGIS